MLRMAIEMSEMQFKQKQEDNFGLNGANLIEEEKENILDEVMDMDSQHGMDSKEREEKKRTFLMDLVQHCTKDLSEPADIAVAKIAILYVISKYVNRTEDIPVFC